MPFADKEKERIWRRAYAKRWRVANPDRSQATQRRFYERHAVERRESAKRWRERNKEQVREYQRSYWRSLDDARRQRRRELKRQRYNAERVRAYRQRPDVREANRQRNTLWREANYWRLRGAKYGISADALQRLWALQDGRCANPSCGRHLNPRAAHLDHEHAGAQRVRGFLCRSCNVAIGFGRDDPAVIRGLAGYLEKFTPPGNRVWGAA